MTLGIRTKRAFPLIFLLALLFPAASCQGAGPASPAPAPAAPEVPADLVGTWHTVSVDGDCLFLIIREVRVTLKSDGRFVGSVRFRDDSVKALAGSFRVGPHHLLAVRDPASGEEGAFRYEVRDQGRKLRLHDEKFSVSVDMTRVDASASPR